jgi:chemotaxis protein MotB
LEKKPEEKKGGVPEWMATYGDLVTLLMCFFVLLFAFSSIDAKKFEAVMVSFQGSAGILPGGTSLKEDKLAFDGMPEKDTTSSSQLELNKMEEVAEQIQQYITENNLQSEVVLEVEERGIVLRFPDRALFDPGSAILKDDSRTSLDLIAGLFKQKKFSSLTLRVEGHTDNIPTTSDLFPTNWELSTARSTNVVRYFVEKMGVVPTRLSATGFGEFQPIADNSTPIGRAKNRRVDIVILTSEILNNETQNN